MHPGTMEKHPSWPKSTKEAELSQNPKYTMKVWSWILKLREISGRHALVCFYASWEMWRRSFLTVQSPMSFNSTGDNILSKNATIGGSPYQNVLCPTKTAVDWWQLIIPASLNSDSLSPRYLPVKSGMSYKYIESRTSWKDRWKSHCQTLSISKNFGSKYFVSTFAVNHFIRLTNGNWERERERESRKNPRNKVSCAPFWYGRISSIHKRWNTQLQISVLLIGGPSI